MPRNGSGAFTRVHDWTSDADAGVDIRADRMDEDSDDFAQALSDSIAKDGQTATTARIPFAAGIKTDSIEEITPGAGVSIDGIEGGTYTPSLTNVTNIAASTAYVAQYIKVGSVVTVSGKVDIDPTAGSVATELGISLPFASNFAASQQAGGTAVQGGQAGLCASINGDPTNNRASLFFVNTADTDNRSWTFQFMYLIV